jgi:hypothetical protein
MKSLEITIEESRRQNEDYLAAQANAINHHNAEIDNLRSTIQEKEREGVKVYDEISATKKQVEDRESEIF